VGADAGRLWIVVGRWSVLIAPSHVIVGLMLLVLSLAVAVVSLRLGKFPVSTQEVIDALQGQGRKIVQVVIVKWKLPRIVLGLVAGPGLAPTLPDRPGLRDRHQSLRGRHDPRDPGQRPGRRLHPVHRADLDGGHRGW